MENSHQRGSAPIHIIVIPEDAYRQNEVYRPWVEPADPTNHAESKHRDTDQQDCEVAQLSATA